MSEKKHQLDFLAGERDEVILKCITRNEAAAEFPSQCISLSRPSPGGKERAGVKGEPGEDVAGSIGECEAF